MPGMRPESTCRRPPKARLLALLAPALSCGCGSLTAVLWKQPAVYVQTVRQPLPLLQAWSGSAAGEGAFLLAFDRRRSPRELVEQAGLPRQALTEQVWVALTAGPREGLVRALLLGETAFRVVHSTLLLRPDADLEARAAGDPALLAGELILQGAVRRQEFAMVLSPVEADRRFPQFASLPPEPSTTPMTLAAVFGTQPWLELVGDDEHLHRYELLALVDARDRQVEAGGLEALLVNKQMRAADFAAWRGCFALGRVMASPGGVAASLLVPVESLLLADRAKLAVAGDTIRFELATRWKPVVFAHEPEDFRREHELTLAPWDCALLVTRDVAAREMSLGMKLLLTPLTLTLDIVTAGLAHYAFCGDEDEDWLQSSGKRGRK